MLIVGGGLDAVQPSLSAYYHFSAAHPSEPCAGTMRDVFVGMLFAIGAFLFFYRGHSVQEDAALNVAGISAVLVALLPMDWPPDSKAPATLSAHIHSTSAIIFFVMIAYVCIFRAQDTLCLMRSSRRRRIFRRVYLVMGIAMFATPAAVSALDIVAPGRNGYSTLIIEVAGVFVFAAFWLIKSVEIRSSLHPRFVPLRPIRPKHHPTPDGNDGRDPGGRAGPTDCAT
ncbi:hypothetical protein FHS95_003361 [Sphingomonas naasensis]|uniref:DUF998 domain-containing protein n=1 Tax=Sphingomonas naasensis TaxID=1344951 RepID=UPI00141B4608|nr:DUF998 domain-containing protein [Sphingomonas naasensis]NIJ21658.1 hypothetical protein [Sphingomonas naasensis]